MNKLIGNAVVGQSGGPTAAINATLAGVIKGALNNSDTIKTLYGMRNGIEGFLKENLIDLTARFTGKNEDLDILASTPAAALGSCRKKLPKLADDAVFYNDVLTLFKKYDIRYFFYIGGNDSMDTVSKLREFIETTDYDMRIVGVPKTIDNDLAGTDHTPGFGSAAKYIATTVSEIIRDCSVYTIPAVTIVEIMGRDAGWLTASAGLPKLLGLPAPDYIYLPEVPFSFDNFIEDVKAALSVHPNVVIAVSEGVRDKDGHYAGEGTQSGVTDVFGHKYLSGTGKALELYVKEKIGCKVRSVELNISQRCAAHIQSLTDRNEALGVSESAVNAAINGATGCMMSMQRNSEGVIEFISNDIKGIANAVKSVPLDMINEKGNYVTDNCLKYIYPLIQGESPIAFKDGLPVQIIL